MHFSFGNRKFCFIFIFLDVDRFVVFFLFVGFTRLLTCDLKACGFDSYLCSCIVRVRERGLLHWNKRKTRDSSFGDSVPWPFPIRVSYGLSRFSIFWNYGVDQLEMAWNDLEDCNLNLIRFWAWSYVPFFFQICLSRWDASLQFKSTGLKFRAWSWFFL